MPALPHAISRPTCTRRAFAGLATGALVAAALPSSPGHAAAEGSPASDEPAEPDYGQADAWAYWGHVADGVDDPPADLFIVCPTVSSGDDGAANMSLDAAADRTSLVGALNMELGIYADVCRVFAPFYRQATLEMYAREDDELDEALAFAYQDVRTAFAHFLEATAGDGVRDAGASTADAGTPGDPRPLVLAGFSQGADMAIRLVEEFGEELDDRLVAAYAIGWRLEEEACERCAWLRAAQRPDDVGVVVTFSSEDPEVEDSIIVPASTRTLAINPLSWEVSSKEAPASANLGACFTDYDGEITLEIPEFCGAYLDPGRGVLKVTGVDPDDYPPALDIFGPGVYHVYDYQFFYRNLQENVRARVAAFAGGARAEGSA